MAYDRALKPLNHPRQPGEPRVSVLVPSYNYARFLPETLDSVLHQDFDDYELLVIDDHSDDASAAVLERYAKRDSRVRHRINPERRGMVQNWNDCLEWARGDYIKFLFADDRLTFPSALGQMVEQIEARPDVRLVGCAREIIDEQSRTVAVKCYAREATIRSGAEVVAAWLGRMGNPIGEPSSVLFRRADARRGFDPRYRQLVDAEMWFHLLQGGAFAYIPECLCSFRRHDAQQSSQNRGRGIVEAEDAMLIETYGRRVFETGNRKDLFELAYRIRRLPEGPSRAGLMRDLRDHWGSAGSLYPLHHVRHRVVRPFQNLARTFWQRELRKDLDRRRAVSARPR